MGLNINDMFPSKWLKAEDFEDGESKTLTIKDIAYQELGQGAKKESKPVIEFREDKPLVLNKTNASIIAQLYGSDTDEWIGKKIVLYSKEVDSFGDIVKAVRVRDVIPGEGSSAPRPATQSEDMITDSQKKILLKEGERVFGSVDAVAKLKQALGSINKKTYREAEEAITWLKEKADYRPEPVEDDFDDNDPFADD